MKKIFLTQLFLGLLIAAARADVALSLAYTSSLPCCGGPCWDDEGIVIGFPQATGTFTLNGVSGTGTINSTVVAAIDNIHERSHLLYRYTLDMTGLSQAPNHCVKLLIHFGTPIACVSDVLVLTNTPGQFVSSASKAVFGDITFGFGSGCLTPGQAASSFEMQTDVGAKTNVVDVIDDYVDPANGTTNHVVIAVTAVVPNIPPNWAYVPFPIPVAYFQGLVNTNYVGTNQYNNTNFPLSGQFDFSMQLVDALTNGLPLGPPSTTTVAIVNGLLNTPLPFDPSSYTGGTRYLNLGIRPSGLPAVQFTPLNPPISLAPTPQAFFAYSAGVVANVSPDQAVVSLNGITGNMNLIGGPGIQVAPVSNGDGKTLMISQIGSPSDRNIKTDFVPVNPAETLDKLVAMPIQTWRFTNESADIRHLGPTAQDFKATFGLGTSDKLIGNVDEGGVALSAIQGLNKKLEAESKTKDAEILRLQQRLDELEKRLEDPITQK